MRLYVFLSSAAILLPGAAVARSVALHGDSLCGRVCTSLYRRQVNTDKTWMHFETCETLDVNTQSLTVWGRVEPTACQHLHACGLPSGSAHTSETILSPVPCCMFTVQCSVPRTLVVQVQSVRVGQPAPVPRRA